LTLWNQQGSHVRRGALLVIPTGRALLYAEPIYLQAERSPMPELRLVVLALQDRLAYAPTFESAMSALFGGGVSLLSATAVTAQPSRSTSASAAPPQPAEDRSALNAEDAKDLADYQRLTAEGKLGEAGQKLEELKRALDKLNRRAKIISLVCCAFLQAGQSMDRRGRALTKVDAESSGHAGRCPHPLHQHRRVARPVALALEVLRYTLLAERE
jgi:hypothetical protein